MDPLRLSKAKPQKDTNQKRRPYQEPQKPYEKKAKGHQPTTNQKGKPYETLAIFGKKQGTALGLLSESLSLLLGSGPAVATLIPVGDEATTEECTAAMRTVGPLIDSLPLTVGQNQPWPFMFTCWVNLCVAYAVFSLRFWGTGTK